MNNLINKCLLAGEKFTPEMHLGQPKYNYITCRSFTQTKALIQKFKETGGSKYIYQNELEKACFQNDLAYGGFKGLARRILIKIQNMMGISSMQVGVMGQKLEPVKIVEIYSFPLLANNVLAIETSKFEEPFYRQNQSDLVTPPFVCYFRCLQIIF